MKTNLLKRRPSSAFTLLELLVVMTIISILMGLIFAMGPRVLLAIRKQSVQGDMQQLEMAILEYYNEYGRYPLSNDLQGGDVIIGGDGSVAGTEEIMNVLLGEPNGWNEGHALNPRRKQFLTPRPARGESGRQRNGLGDDGKLYDMWGNEFEIYLDANYDDRLSGANADGFTYTDKDILSADGSFSGRIMILSVGSDGVLGKDDSEEGETKYEGSDDVASWL